MYSKRFDILLGFVGLLLVVAGFYQLYIPREMKVGSGIGLLEIIENTVKTRDGSHLFWVTPLQGSAVKDNQLIFTARGARAQVGLNDGNVIQVNESSLVKIKAQNLEFIEGEVKAKLSGKDLEIHTKGKKLTLKSSDAEVSLYQTGENTIIGVNSGDVDIHDGQKTLKANSSKLVEVENKEIVLKNKLDIDPKPLPNQIFYSKEDKELINFGEYAGSILISSDKTFKKTQLLKGSSTYLGVGQYYWRVKASDSESIIYRFEVKKVEAPKIFRPQNGSLFESEIPVTINLQWEDQELSHILQLKFENGIQEFKVDQGLHQHSIDKAGQYEWRVGTLVPNLADPAWSDWNSFEVLDLRTAIPKELAPAIYEVQTYEVDQEFINFTWNYSREVIVSVWKDNQIILTEKARDHFKWQVPSEGEFVVKVKDAHNPLELWSESSKISVKDLSRLKDVEIQKVELKRPDQEVQFSWQGSGEDYLFELSQTQSFEKIILSKKVKDSQTKVSIPEVGDYYWRSRVLVDGKWKASPPKKVIIQPIPAPQKPKSLPELKVPLNLKKVKATFEVFPSAFANANGFVKITLPDHEEAKSYRLQIFQDKDLQKKIHEKVSSKNEFLWEQAQAGTFYYRYSIIDYWDRESEPSEASLLQVTAQHLTPSTPKKLAISETDKELKITWNKDELSAFTEIQIADNTKFNNPQTVRISNDQYTLKKKPQSYFIRIRSLNDFGKSKWVKEEYKVEEKVAQKVDLEKRNKIFFIYRPSSDSLTFEDGEEGKIDGTTLGAVELRYERLDRFLKVFKADFITGKVFDDESYRQYSIEGSLLYFVKGDKWHWGAGAVAKFWQMPEFKIQEKVKSEDHFNTVVGLHARVARTLGTNKEFVFDQYVYALSVTGFMSELSYRQSFNSFYLFTGAGFEKIKVGDQDRNSIILKVGLGFSF
jgi:hypothetical protein